eukprot:Gb_22506 [translate_table: standard]
MKALWTSKAPFSVIKSISVQKDSGNLKALKLEFCLAKLGFTGMGRSSSFAVKFFCVTIFIAGLTAVQARPIIYSIDSQPTEDYSGIPAPLHQRPKRCADDCAPPPPDQL